MRRGLFRGWVGYQVLKHIAGCPPRRTLCNGEAYVNRSKLEALLGEQVWDRLRNRTVLDFGCASGAEAVEMAGRGAARVVGLDTREDVLERARERARAAGVADRCHFTTEAPGPVDVVVSLDAFEHFDDPERMLRTMADLLRPGGEILISFGPSWYHPLGGHAFSVFPWAHLLFSERAFMRWWAEFKRDGATRFSEIDGGLNQMTVGRFGRIVARSGLVVEDFSPMPIRRLKPLWNRLTREFFTSVVRCRLRVPRPHEARTHLTPGTAGAPRTLAVQ